MTECVFFFQAEDGIRDIGVTGVQTCALPISSGATCCQSQPPQRPGPLYGQGRGTRSAAASSTSTASARQKPGWRSSVTRTTTRSPGSACRTNTTRPSWRATQCPPCATGPTVTSNSRPVQPPPRSGPVARFRPRCRAPPRACERWGAAGSFPEPWGAAGPLSIGRVLLLVGQAAAQVAGRRPGRAQPGVLPADRALELPGHRGDHHAGLELQPGAQPQRALVVQQVLPPVADDVLGHRSEERRVGKEC